MVFEKELNENSETKKSSVTGMKHILLINGLHLED